MRRLKGRELEVSGMISSGWHRHQQSWLLALGLSNWVNCGAFSWHREERKRRDVWEKNQEFCSVHVSFEILIRHPSGYEVSLRDLRVKFKWEDSTAHINLGHQYTYGTESRRPCKLKKEKTVNGNDMKYFLNTMAPPIFRKWAKEKSKQRRLRSRHGNKEKAWPCCRLGSSIFRRGVSGQLCQTVRGPGMRTETGWLTRSDKMELT